MEFEEESSDDNNQDYSQMLYGNSEDDEKYEIHDSIEDEDYRGLELDLMVFCRKHGKATERFVAFEGTSSGRRFLACAEQGADNCGFVEWVDPYWPTPMQNALLKLWQMYEDAKAYRRSDNLNSALTIQTLTCEKKSLEDKFQELAKHVDTLFQAQETRTKEHLYVVSEYKKEFEEQKAEIARKEGENQKLNEKYVILENLSRAQGKMIKNVKCNHLKEKERLIEERRKMKLQISQLHEVLANSEAQIIDEVTKLKNELACMTLSNEKLTEEVSTSSSWNQLLNEKMK
uniref:GRF-type domain-containing protein n=1 Tax=Hordeum vulgare subsp. vulgare TaxID=112509 RepID=A0A8I6XNX8_HORVV